MDDVFLKTRLLSDSDGYFRRFYEIYAETDSQIDAWQQIEHEREEIGLPERYSSYESFKRGKSYHYHNNLIRVNTGDNLLPD